MAPRDEPRWLDDTEQQAWLTFANVVMRLPSVLDGQLQRDAGISHFEFVIMARLSETPGRQLRMSAIALSVKASLSRLSQAVARLEKRGWVRRGPDPEDGRYTIATLTDEGMAKVVDTAPGHVAAVREYVIDQLTASQVGQLAAISQRIIDTLPPDATWPSQECGTRRQHGDSAH
ncbi:MarR family transcriptional regulator [Mycobacterium sp. NBC_00419]|uniref:MarR family winged helix-turn-helix transcriptional regulator n=1 Tax=Mycobacterium sp. NBC_00419 TaxID=2975989 RepID=UPI002E200754